MIVGVRRGEEEEEERGGEGEEMLVIGRAACV